MKKEVLVSDLSGRQLEEGQGARVKLYLDHVKDTTFELDVHQDEIRELIEAAVRMPRRGRPPR